MLPLVAACLSLVAATYGLVRFAYGLYLPEMQQELGVDDATAGTVSAGSSLAYCVGALVGSLVAARRPAATVAAAAATAATGAAGLAVAPGASLFVAAAVLSSSGAGLASPAVVAVLGRALARSRASVEDRDRAQSTANAGTGPGLVAAGLVAFALLPSWRAGWAAAAVVTVLAGVAVLGLHRAARGVETGPPSARPQGQSRSAADEGAVAPTASPASALLPPPSWWRVHRRVVVAALLLGVGSAAVWNQGRVVLVAAGWADATSVSAWLALGAGGASVVLTSARSARVRPPVAWATATLVAAAGTLALGLAPEVPSVALLAFAAFGWGYTAATGALIAWTTSLDASRAAAGTALLFVLLVLGQALGAVGAGLVTAAGSPAPTFALAAGTVTMSAAAGLDRWRTRPRAVPVRGR